VDEDDENISPMIIED